MSHQNFIQFIEKTLLLHDCSKIHKFQIQSHFNDMNVPQFAEKIDFATRKHVEDLNLSARIEEILPEIIFNHASLVKLSTNSCSFMPNGKVNWGCLSSLEIAEFELTCEAMEHILSGSPLLKSLKLINSAPKKIVIASKSLKKLLIHSYIQHRISVLQVSCPNLEELSLRHISGTNDPQMLAQAIYNVLSISSLLDSLELIGCCIMDQLVIASKSLKKFVRQEYHRDFHIEISCPQLEELKLLSYLQLNTAKLMNLPSSLCVTIDFYCYERPKPLQRMIIELLQQLQHFKELKVGYWFIEILSTIKVGVQFSTMLNIKCLTLNAPHLIKHHFGIAHLLCISPLLESLLINVPRSSKANHTNFGKNYWDSNVVVFDCLVSHLKTIKIMGFPGRGGRREHMLNLVKFLLKNARVLEKMVVLLGDHIGTSQSDLSQILLSLPRCSQNAIIEVL